MSPNQKLLGNEESKVFTIHEARTPRSKNINFFFPKCLRSRKQYGQMAYVFH